MKSLDLQTLASFADGTLSGMSSVPVSRVITDSRKVQPGDLFVALKAYHTANNPNIGRSNPIMAAQVQAFNAKELKLLAQHIASLPGDLKTVPQPRLR